MATIKSFTSLEQSKKLAEILPTESADAFYIVGKKPVDIVPIYGSVTHQHLIEQMAYKRAIPCWSLAALLSVLPKINNYRAEIREENNCFCCAYTQKDNNGDLYWYYADNPVDACVAMIDKLHELKIL